jgi:hypothetical protein
MNTSTLNFTIINSPNTKYSDAQILLQEFTGREFARGEADSIWIDVLDHKWNLSEKLERDVGFRVATIDFIENFYQPKRANKHMKNTKMREIRIPRFLSKAVRFYFETKGDLINF